MHTKFIKESVDESANAIKRSDTIPRMWRATARACICARVCVCLCVRVYIFLLFFIFNNLL